MATVPNNTRTDQQLRRDRWAAAVVLLMALVILAVMVLASIFGEGSIEPMDPWHMMP